MSKSEMNTTVTNSQQTCISNKFTFKIFLVLKLISKQVSKILHWI